MSSRIPAALLPTKMPNGSWRGPLIKSRKAALIRKNAIRSNKYFVGADLSKGEWDPIWDRANKATVLREPKGLIRWRNRDERVAKIEEAMATMDEKIEEHHMARINQKPASLLSKELEKLGFLKTDAQKPTSKKAKKKQEKKA